MPDDYAPPDDVAAALRSWGVGAAELARLKRYVEVLDRWRRRINLIGPADVGDIWRRHVLDSAQLWPQLSDDRTRPTVDFGSGAGLPGLVLAILGAEDVTLIDSDRRKAVFLQETARAVDVAPRIIAQRFDAALAETGRMFHVATGRAVAPLPRLAETLESALEDGGYALLHKGGKVETELTETRKSWSMEHALIPSITGVGGVLLKIWGLRRHDEAG